jgi:hypothetical protein
MVVNGIGHNVPQEAPQAFAEAVIEVDRLDMLPRSSITRAVGVDISR